jgi:two-component system chemotaxis response regulator CheY
MPLTILVVDDSATTRAVIRRIISMCGLDAPLVIEAPDGGAGLDAARKSNPDLILADLQMPVLNGVEMVKRLLADPATKSIPVVIVSAEPSRDTIAQLRDIGARGHVTKPFTPERLRTVITEILGVPNA